jgi:hypothetical protein
MAQKCDAPLRARLLAAGVSEDKLKQLEALPAFNWPALLQLLETLIPALINVLTPPAPAP